MYWLIKNILQNPMAGPWAMKIKTHMTKNYIYFLYFDPIF